MAVELNLVSFYILIEQQCHPMSNIDSVAAESAKLMVSRVFISDKPVWK